MQDLGANWMRLTMSWGEIEQSGKGSYSRLDRYDTAFANAAATGAKRHRHGAHVPAVGVGPDEPRLASGRPR